MKTFSPMVQQSPVGQGLLIIESTRSHSDTPQSVGLLWTSDQPDADTSTHITHNRQTYMPLAGIESVIPATERTQTRYLDRAATGISAKLIYKVIHKPLRDLRTRLRNNQDRHGRKEHINR